MRRRCRSPPGAARPTRRRAGAASPLTSQPTRLQLTSRRTGQRRRSRPLRRQPLRSRPLRSRPRGRQQRRRQQQRKLQPIPRPPTGHQCRPPPLRGCPRPTRATVVRGVVAGRSAARPLPRPGVTGPEDERGPARAACSGTARQAGSASVAARTNPRQRRRVMPLPSQRRRRRRPQFQPPRPSRLRWQRRQTRRPPSRRWAHRPAGAKLSWVSLVAPTDLEPSWPSERRPTHWAGRLTACARQRNPPVPHRPRPRPIVPLGPSRRSSLRPPGPSRPPRSRHRACSPKPRRPPPRQHRPRAFPAPGRRPLARRLRDLPPRCRLVPVRPGQVRATMPPAPRPRWPAVQGADPARTSLLRERAQWLRVQWLRVRPAVDLAQVPLRLVVQRAVRLRRPREPVRLVQLVQLVVQLAGPMPSAQVHEPVRLGPPWEVLRRPPARRPARPDRDGNRPGRRPERSRLAVRARRGDRISATSEQRRLQPTRCGSTSPGQPATGRFQRRLPSRRLLLPLLR
jgi:hypothetical protein